jgi:uncharacterized protein YdeI (YjbR/CyaY-like superfamily)
MEPIFLHSQAEWHEWLAENHDKENEFQMGFHKTKSKTKGITNAQAVDEALCFGWIDGVVNGIDVHTWTKRFTPRKPKSIWSNINTRRVAELIADGRMQPAGLKAFALRDEKRAGIYSFEKEVQHFSGPYLEAFAANKKAWENFLKMPPSYKTPATNWVLSAKHEETRQRRLEKLIDCSEKGERIDSLKPRVKK